MELASGSNFSFRGCLCLDQRRRLQVATFPDNYFPTVKDGEQFFSNRKVQRRNIDANRAFNTCRAAAGFRWLKIQSRLFLKVRDFQQLRSQSRLALATNTFASCCLLADVAVQNGTSVVSIVFFTSRPQGSVASSPKRTTALHRCSART